MNPSRLTLALRWLVYAGMAAVVALGLAGQLERDGSASARVGDDSARVTWPAVTRQGLMPSITVEIENAGPVARAPVVRVSAGYLRTMQFASATPEPESTDAVGEGLVEIRFADLSPGHRLEATLHFDIAQQAEGLRAHSRLVVELGGRVLVSEPISTTILP